MKWLLNGILQVAVIFAATCISFTQNPLWIPPAITGTNFNLNVQSGSQIFYGSTSTPTYGINGPWMCPTLIVNKDDSITLNVINNLPVNTTMHWHGLHVSAMNDGGPHQVINSGSTWSPSFKVRNNASTFWYHPHGEGQTEKQVSKGLAGLLIVKDNAEAALTLPRTYGVDDIPLIVQSKAFDALQQVAIATDMDTALFVNGTLNPFFDAPAQVIRFRLLNGSSLRTYNFGLSNGQNFYQIATDGGLVDSSISLTRLVLFPAERAEILINLSGMAGQSIYLKSYGSELPTGFYGADSVGMGVDTIHEYEENFLNGADFDLLRINILSDLPGGITMIPAALVPFNPHNPASATFNRKIVMDTIRLLPIDPPNRAEGPFGMNYKTFNIDSVNDIVYLNTTEIWTLVNKTLIAHPFHIHDIQFNVIEKSGMPPPENEIGWKDVVSVPPNDSVKFITRFETFADPVTPYMYHCHLLHHEDDGMMGSFLVLDTTQTGTEEKMPNEVRVYPNPFSQEFAVEFSSEIHSAVARLLSVTGQTISIKPLKNSSRILFEDSQLSPGIYFIQIQSDNISLTKKIIKQ